jgi:hypothetical protein
MPAGERAHKRGAAQAALFSWRVPHAACVRASTTLRLPAFYFLLLRMIFSENRKSTFRDHALPEARH